MREVFADTSYYQALLNRRDRHHEQATYLSKSVKGRTVTSEYVLCELGALMCSAPARSAFVSAVRKLQASRKVEIVIASHELFEAGVDLFHKRPDKDWSLVDCISFVLMRERNIAEALSTDKHFEQAGFRALLV